jgi:hypothetical protein
MGSTNTGRVGDYPGSSKPPTGLPGGGGGSTPPLSDRCARAISVALEDIEHCDYFATHGVVPSVGEVLRVAQRKRIVAETSAGVTVGNLPTSYNYLVHLAGSLDAVASVSGDKGFPLHGPAEWFRHGGIEVCDEAFDPLLEMVL